jgi:anti-sigma regulatory factor (Ser/Thr protein kinase)
MTALTLPGRLESLDQVAEFVQAAAHEAHLDTKAAYRLQLAVDEVATNVVTHAYQEKGLEGQLYLTAEIDEHALRIHIEDTGQPYDPTTRPDPTNLDQPLEDREIGGLGLFLARRSVDELRYERRGDRNRITCLIRRPASA